MVGLSRRQSEGSGFDHVSWLRNIFRWFESVLYFIASFLYCIVLHYIVKTSKVQLVTAKTRFFLWQRAFARNAGILYDQSRRLTYFELFTLFNTVYAVFYFCIVLISIVPYCTVVRRRKRCDVQLYKGMETAREIVTSGYCDSGRGKDRDLDR